MYEFYHNKRLDMLKLGCTLPNLANICLHKSTDSKYYPFTESDKDFLEEIREIMVGGLSIVFTRKAVVDETFIRKSSNLCKSIVGIDASQLYPYSMCQPMPTGLYTRWEYNSETERFTAHENKSRSFENMVLSYFQESRTDCKIESNVTTGRQKKNDCFSVDGICYHCNTVFEAMGCYYHYFPCQEERPSLTDTDFERGWKSDNKMRCVGITCNKRVTKLLKCGSVSGGASIKLMHQSKVTSEKNPCRRPLSEEQLLQGIIDGRHFGFFQCDIEVPEHLLDYFSNFPPIFKNTVVSRDGICSLMKQYAEKESIMVQHRRKLISSFIRTNGTIITPFVLFYLNPGLVCKKIYRFVQNTPRKCFNIFVLSAVNARRQGDENTNSSVVAETKKLLANSS